VWRLLFLLPLALAFACSGSEEKHSTTVASSAGRSTSERPDDLTGPQIHLVYALPSDGVDRRLDIDGTIARSIAASQRWLAGQTDGRKIRLDAVGGEPDITFFRLSRSDVDLKSEGAFTREAIEGELKGQGFDSADKIYAVYYDGGSTYACGSGAYPPTLPGSVLVLFLHGEPLNGAIRCGDNDFAADADSPVFWEFVIMHELLHTLGFVADCAPHETMGGHITGPANDLMYEGEEESDLPKALDVGHDDYFKTEIVGCLDFEDSPYLIP
jgi:hypothetical protein